MTKYSYHFKQQIVNEYLKGSLVYRSLAKKYEVSNSSLIRTWVNQYKLFGKESLQLKKGKAVYPLEFKLKVLHFKQDTGASYRETAEIFGLDNPSLIANWKRKFITEGTDGLNKPVGRPPNMSKKSKKQIHKYQKNVSDHATSKRLKALEEENEYLKTEVAYLKKLKALRAQQSQEKNNSSSFIPSDEKDSH